MNMKRNIGHYLIKLNSSVNYDEWQGYCNGLKEFLLKHNILLDDFYDNGFHNYDNFEKIFEWQNYNESELNFFEGFIYEQEKSRYELVDFALFKKLVEDFFKGKESISHVLCLTDMKNTKRFGYYFIKLRSSLSYDKWKDYCDDLNKFLSEYNISINDIHNSQGGYNNNRGVAVGKQKASEGKLDFFEGSFYFTYGKIDFYLFQILVKRFFKNKEKVMYIQNLTNVKHRKKIRYYFIELSISMNYDKWQKYCDSLKELFYKYNILLDNFYDSHTNDYNGPDINIGKKIASKEKLNFFAGFVSVMDNPYQPAAKVDLILFKKIIKRFFKGKENIVTISDLMSIGNRKIVEHYFIELRSSLNFYQWRKYCDGLKELLFKYNILFYDFFDNIYDIEGAKQMSSEGKLNFFEGEVSVLDNPYEEKVDFYLFQKLITIFFKGKEDVVSIKN